MNKWLLHQNGFTRTSLLATVTQISILLRKMGSFFTSSRLPIPGAFSGTFSHSMPNTSNMSIAMHLACSKNLINVLRFTVYHVEGRLKLMKFFLTVKNSTFNIEVIQSYAKNVAFGLSLISNRPHVAYLILVKLISHG